MKRKPNKKEQKEEPSSSAEELFMEELERREQEMKQLGRQNVQVHKNIEIQIAPVIQHKQNVEVINQLKQVEQRIMKSSGLQQQLLHALAALLTFAIHIDEDDHPVFERITELEQLIEHCESHEHEEIKSSNEQLNQDNSIEHENDELQEYGEEFGEDFGDEEEEEQEPDIVLPDRAHRQLDAKLSRTNVTQAIFDETSSKYVAPELKVIKQKSADSLGVLFEEKASAWKKKAIEERRASDAKAENKIDKVERIQEKKTTQKEPAKRNVVQIQPRQPKKQQLVEGESRPASRALAKNQPDLQQPKRKIAKLNLKKKYNKLQNEKRKYMKNRDAMMDNYFGERFIKDRK